MDLITKNFLKLFEPKISEGIVEFGKNVSLSDSDIFIVMARKSACFIDCLIDLNLVNLGREYITSDRILDMNCEGLKGKKVSIIDDALVTGTTIYKTIQKLKEFGVSSIDVYVLCINESFYIPSLIENEEKTSYLVKPYLTVSNEECVKACADIVKAISFLSRPYDIDYPYFHGDILNNFQFKKLLFYPEWESDDITNTFQNRHQLSTITITPNKLARFHFDDIVGFELSKIAILKIRLYVRHVNSKKIYLKFLPIVVFKPLTVDNLEILFEKVINSSGISIDRFESFNSNSSKLRLLQYIYSIKLFKFWFESATDNIFIPNINQIKSNLNFLFEKSTHTYIFDLLKINNSIFFTVNEIPKIRKEEVNKDGIENNDLMSINAKLLKPFLELYYDKELKARKMVKKFGVDAFSIPEYQETLDRLKIGFSISTLLSIVGNDKNYNTTKVISLFLDKNIDSGIIVPTITEKDGYIYRSYRHGEDVQFGEREEKLLAILLKSVYEEIDSRPLQHLWVEKLIVLFIKIGVQIGLLEQILSDIQPVETMYSNKGHSKHVVSVKTYLHGPVAVRTESDKFNFNPHLNKAYLNSGDYNSWLSEILLNKKILKREKSNNLYRFYKSPNFQENESDKGKTENIGLVLGQVIKKAIENSKTKELNEQLVILTACKRPEEIAQAMAAELNIFSSSWIYEKDKIYSAFESSNIEDLNELIIYLRKGELKFGRRQGNQSFTAINSGQKKFFWFVEKTFQQVIDNISDDLSSKVEINLWKGFWSSNLDWSELNIESELWENILNQGLWLISANIYIRILEINLRRKLSFHISSNLIQENNNEIRVTLEKIKSFLNKLQFFKNKDRGIKIIPFTTNFIDSFDLINTETEVDDKIKDTLKNINILQSVSVRFLEEVDLMINKFGKILPISRYPNMLYIQINESETNDSIQKQIWLQIRCVITKYYKIIEQHNERYKSKTEALIRIIELPIEKNILKKGLWIACSGGLADNTLINLANDIHNEVSVITQIKLVVFSQLPENSRIKQAGNSNTNIREGFFWLRVQTLKKFFFEENITNSSLTTIIENKKDLLDEFTKLESANKLNYSLISEETVLCKEPESEYKIKKYNRLSKMKNADIGVITVVSEELTSVLESFNISPIDSIDKGFRKFYETTIQNHKNKFLTVAITQQVQMGNRSASNAINALIKNYNPRYIFLVGIAGSINKKSKLCDVIIADKVIYYEEEKETVSGNNSRWDTFKISAPIKPVVQQFTNMIGIPTMLNAGENSYRPKFEVLIGTIASGERVLANSASELLEKIKKSDDKLLAIEMEAGGFLQGFYESELDNNTNQIASLVIRGISDHADEEKDDKWRYPSSKNACKVMIEIIKLLS